MALIQYREISSEQQRTYGHGGNTMKKGTITKLLYKGQKVYAVVAGFDETDVTVRFPSCGVSGTVEIIELIVPKAACRKPMYLGQTAEMATLIRQLARVTLEDEVQ
jgi:hypothetical protein